MTITRLGGGIGELLARVTKTAQRSTCGILRTARSTTTLLEEVLLLRLTTDITTNTSLPALNILLSLDHAGFVTALVQPEARTNIPKISSASN